jgi:glutamyl-tRNA synthetase
MLKGEPQYQQYYLRAKINMQDHNHLLRDPPIYHQNQTPHRRTSKKYKIYPTYNFATPIIDHL